MKCLQLLSVVCEIRVRRKFLESISLHFKIVNLLSAATKEQLLLKPQNQVNRGLNLLNEEKIFPHYINLRIQGFTLTFAVSRSHQLRY